MQASDFKTFFYRYEKLNLLPWSYLVILIINNVGGGWGAWKSTRLVLFILQIPAQLTVNDIKYKIDDILLDTSLIVANDGKDLKSVAKMLMSTPSKRIDR